MNSMLMGLREYARHRGVTLKAVQKAIQEGRIEVVLIDGAKKIDPKKADAMWTERTTPKVEGSDPSGTYYKSKAEKEFYAAKIAEFEYKKRTGELLEVSDVKRELQRICTICRDHLLNLPDQLAPEIAGETNPHNVSILLYKRINECLSDLSGALEKMVTTDDPVLNSKTS